MPILHRGILDTINSADDLEHSPEPFLDRSQYRYIDAPPHIINRIDDSQRPSLVKMQQRDASGTKDLQELIPEAEAWSSS